MEYMDRCWVSDWANFQLYHGMNKLIFNETMIMLCPLTRLAWLFMLLAHWVIFYLILLFLIAIFKVERQRIQILWFIWSDCRSNKRSTCSIGGYIRHHNTEAIRNTSELNNHFYLQIKRRNVRIGTQYARRYFKKIWIKQGKIGIPN